MILAPTLAVLLAAGPADAVRAAESAAQQRPQDFAPDSELAPFVRRYHTDWMALRRFYDLPMDGERLDRFEAFHRDWRARLQEMDFGGLSHPAQVDFVLLRSYLDHELEELAIQRRRQAQDRELLPFAAEILVLEKARRAMEPLDPRNVAAALAGLESEVKQAHEAVEEAEAKPGAVAAKRAAETAEALRRTLARWFEFYAEFDPTMSWWAEKPHRAAMAALEEYAGHLREDIAGQKGEEEDPLVGDPIGREAIGVELAFEMMPYSPEEIIAIGEREFAWCEREMLKASEELGFGDHWLAALEEVKSRFVEPGEQDDLVEEFAWESIAFLDRNDLVTIPELCRETWRLEMIGARGQRTHPFAYYGGQHMALAYAASGMDHQAKIEAMRGNNIHFTRNVTPHELVPGHHLQGFMSQRWNTHRRLFGTPFYGEGWALYWEFRYWDLGWNRSPEDRIGMLFWRMHRAARIIVSLKFHLNEMEPQEMIDFLVERVGHERDNATAEVRRFIGGDYGPLYQCAYMIGGVQLRALHAELVQSGRMGEREFHDAVLRLNSMPIEMVRAALLELPLTPEFRSGWRF